MGTLAETLCPDQARSRLISRFSRTSRSPRVSSCSFGQNSLTCLTTRTLSVLQGPSGALTAPVPECSLRLPRDGRFSSRLSLSSNHPVPCGELSLLSSPQYPVALVLSSSNSSSTFFNRVQEW